MLTRSSIDWQRGKKINFHFAIPNPVCQWGGGGGGWGTGVLEISVYPDIHERNVRTVP